MKDISLCVCGGGGRGSVTSGGIFQRIDLGFKRKRCGLTGDGCPTAPGKSSLF